MNIPIKINSEILYFPISENKTIQIIKSGWDNYYHVIIENGEMVNTIHTVLTKENILENYNIEID